MNQNMVTRYPETLENGTYTEGKPLRCYGIAHQDGQEARMYKFSVLLTAMAVAVVFAITGCGNQYGDVEAVLDTEIDVMSAFIEDMENAGDAEDVAAAIRTYTDGMEKLIPQLKEIAQNYPDMQGSDDVPAAVKAKADKVAELAGQLSGAVMKATSYMMDPTVQEAWENFGQVMAAMGEAS